jgi:hypothetical protein
VNASAGGEIVLQDPYHEYAVRFLELARDRGLRAVCLYTDRLEMLRRAREFPALEGPDVAAAYLIEGRGVEEVADHLRAHHRVVAVVPHNEPAVLGLGRLADLLDLPWAQPGVLDRFRDKRALKELLRSVPDGPRVNAFAAVSSASDVRDAIATGHFPSFVLKPNDGYGNTTIGFFQSAGDPSDYETYVAERAGSPLLMEEYIGGEEYFVNGQVDAHGEVEAFAVRKYRRRDVNGRKAVAMGDVTVRTTDPAFDAIVGYAAEVMRATGLRSSPFHLECKVDESGPCLIEVAARLVGGDLALIDPLLHGSLDMLSLALHYYLGGSEHMPSGVDWKRYDEDLLGTVNGISTTTSILYEIEGQGAVEAREEFVAWANPPRIGSRLVPTVDLLHRPWRAVVRVPTEERYVEIADELQVGLRLNETSTGVRRVLRRGLAYAPLVRARIDRVRRPPSFVVPLP